MNRNRLRLALVAVVVVALLGCIGAVQLRQPLSAIVPIHHTGKVMRVVPLDPGTPDERLQILFEDGFECQGKDDSFAAVREGDTIAVRGRPFVAGTPFSDPEWWDCKEARLERLFPQSASAAPTQP